VNDIDNELLVDPLGKLREHLAKYAPDAYDLLCNRGYTGSQVRNRFNDLFACNIPNMKIPLFVAEAIKVIDSTVRLAKRDGHPTWEAYEALERRALAAERDLKQLFQASMTPEQAIAVITTAIGGGSWTVEFRTVLEQVIEFIKRRCYGGEQ